MRIFKYEAIRFENRTYQKVFDPLLEEKALQIRINGEVFTVTMRYPSEDECLVKGLLYTEGVIKRNTSLKMEFLYEEGMDKVNVFIPDTEINEKSLNKRRLLSVASCGICGRTELEDVSCEGKLVDRDQIDIELFLGLFQKMKDQQRAFIESGGAHGAAIFDISGNLLTSLEDIGRHNAVDKVIGKAIKDKTLGKGHILIVSGRVSYEIVAKCFKAKIPILAAVSAPSTLAVDFAKELGITLLGFCREGRATCYSGPNRIKLKDYVKKFK